VHKLTKALVLLGQCNQARNLQRRCEAYEKAMAAAPKIPPRPRYIDDPADQTTEQLVAQAEAVLSAGRANMGNIAVTGGKQRQRGWWKYKALEL